MLGVVQSGRLEGLGGLELSVAGLLRPSRLGNDDDQGLGEVRAEAREHEVEAVGVGVV